MRSEIPGYDELQRRIVEACPPGRVSTILDLGIGTGVTARRVLERYPEAALVGVDSSAEMLEAAGRALVGREVRLVPARLQDPLPAGPFDLVVSALAVHHLTHDEKGGLFRRLRAVLSPGGRLVLGDLVIPERPEDVVTVIEDDAYDRPTSVDDLLRRLGEAGLGAALHWVDRDLAVVVADRPPVGPDAGGR